jgi:hypothetical protein
MRMAYEKAIYVESAFVVPLEAAAEVFADIGSIVVLVVGGTANVYVDKNGLVIVEANENHVPVANGE